MESSDLPRPASDPDRDRVTALLVCRDRASQKWGPRWLERSGFEVVLHSSATEALPTATRIRPGILFVEAGLQDDRGCQLVESLRRQLAPEGPPLVVLCSNSRELRKALEGECADIARKPYDWQLISRRAAVLVRTLQTRRELDEVRCELEEAVTAAAKARRQMTIESTIDPLTELPNRKVFENLLNKAIRAPRQTGTIVTMLLLGLDRFGAVNESLGRDGGNAVLALVARRLKKFLHSSDLLAASSKGLVSASLARLEDDQFALMVSNLSSRSQSDFLAKQFLACLDKPIELNGGAFLVNACIGGACFPADGTETESLIEHARAALAEAKRSGGGLVCFNGSLRSEHVRQQLAFDRDLRAALEHDQLLLHYQPIVELTDERVVAAEAMLRWSHPDRGIVPPSEFLRTAEATGLMNEIGAWALRRACAQLRSWIDLGYPPIRVAVNVARSQLTYGGLVNDVRSALTHSGLEPRWLEIELSESDLVGCTSKALSTIRELKDLGVRLSVDDFGTGDSTFADLKRLPVDALKIDRSYIVGAGIRPEDDRISSAMVGMAHRLHLSVVAEGVESSEQILRARNWGCDECQGFLFSGPKPPDQFELLLTQHTPVALQSK